MTPLDHSPPLRCSFLGLTFELIWIGAYPPTSQSLYPFPSKRDEMDCDEHVSSPESSSPLLGKAASDPVHGNVVDNRHPSNASSIAALQPRTRNTSCACVPLPFSSFFLSDGLNCSCSQIPKLVLAQYCNEEGKRTMWSHCEGCGAMDMVLGCNGQPIFC